MGLEEYTPDQLKKELERREKKPVAPKMIDNPDFTALKLLCQDYVDYCVSDAFCEDNDYDDHISEAVIEAFFGEEFWQFFNNLI